MMALARLNSASGSLLTGGGVEGGRGTTSVSSLLPKGFGSWSRKVMPRLVSVLILTDASDARLVAGLFEGTKAVDPASISAAARVWTENFILF